MSMNLGKFRQFDNHDLVELYSTNEGALSKGTIVEYVVANPDAQNGFDLGFANVPGYAFSNDYVVQWKVRAAVSGSAKVAGMLLKDVATTIFDPWAVDARFVSEEKLAEKQVVPTGRAVPFVTRGFFEVTGYDSSLGYPAAGSGAYVSTSGAGIIAVGNPATETRQKIGTWMTQSGSNGTALLRLHL